MSEELERRIKDLEKRVAGLEGGFNEWDFRIVRAGNGYVVYWKGDEGGVCSEVFEGDKAIKRLLWEIIEYFGEGGDKYDKERITVGWEKGSKYVEPEEDR